MAPLPVNLVLLDHKFARCFFPEDLNFVILQDRLQQIETGPELLHRCSVAEHEINEI